MHSFLLLLLLRFWAAEGFQSASPSLPSTAPARDTLDRFGGLVYRTGVFGPDESKLIADEMNSLSHSLQPETSSSVAQNRLGVALSPEHSPTVQLLRDPNNSLTIMVQKLTDKTFQLSHRIPVEVRSYEKTGACMAWHVDDVLCDPPQIEVVWTLENTSDCTTMWKIDDATNCQETDRNSVVLLRAGQTPHCVTTLKRGKRVILKCAYAAVDATYTEVNDQQFGTSKRKKKVNKNRSRGTKR